MLSPRKRLKTAIDATPLAVPADGDPGRERSTRRPGMGVTRPRNRQPGRLGPRDPHLGVETRTDEVLVLRKNRRESCSSVMTFRDSAFLERRDQPFEALLVLDAPKPTDDVINSPGAVGWKVVA